MDEVKEEKKDPIIPDYRDCVYGIKDMMRDHHITLEQAFILLCAMYNIEYESSANDVVPLYNKGLLKPKGDVNLTLLFHLKAAKQLTLDMNFETKPNGNEVTLDIADRIEKEFTSDWLLDDAYRKTTADKYFKGDITVARYFLIFRSLFPMKSVKTNKKWNNKFGIIYDGVNLWDDSLTVAKKFLEIYRKKDIGIFLKATYTTVKDAIDFESQRCFMTKPLKYLNSYSTAYEEAEMSLATQIKNNKPDKDKDYELYV